MMVIDNREEVEGIIDPGSQIIAMLEAVCHDIGLAYDPSIKLNMQSANGEVDQSLGLARNIPCKINSITVPPNPHYPIPSIRHLTRLTLRHPHRVDRQKLP
jgi:hypothetical protein